MKGRDIALFAARTADDKKGTDIVIYDLHGLTDITDYFVIVTAHSKAQIRAITESIRRDLKSVGVHKFGQEGNETGQWVLLDYSDCVIHVFSPQLREYYGLESMWGDAPKLDWAKEPPVELPRRVLATGTDGD
jgi:ribosome-associated protein